MDETNSALKDQPGTVVGLGKIDPILTLTGETDLVHVTGEAKLQERTQ